MTAYGLCFLATELVGLAIASVPVYCHIPSGSFVRTVSVGAIVAAVPAAIFSVIMAAITGWLCEQKKHKVLGYLGALMLVSAVFLACVPRRLYFHSASCAVASAYGGRWKPNFVENLQKRSGPPEEGARMCVGRCTYADGYCLSACVDRGK